MVDKVSISLSVICAIHCLAAPLAAVLLPSLAGLHLHDEAFHLWLVVAILPMSIFALTLGCKKHKRYRVLVLGGIGLFVLVLTVALGHDRLGESWEKTLTVIGASFVALSHILNYRLCKEKDHCHFREQNVF